jgi:hypothetical protein
VPLDRARITYLIDDLKSRPDRLRLVQRIGLGFGVGLILLVVYLLSRGTPPPRPKPKAAEPEAKLTQGVSDAFAYAKAVQPILERDPRFARIYFVPSAATPSQKLGKVVVMGELASEDDLHSLQRELAATGVSVPVEWQVSVTSGPN